MISEERGFFQYISCFLCIVCACFFVAGCAAFAKVTTSAQEQKDAEGTAFFDEALLKSFKRDAMGALEDLEKGLKLNPKHSDAIFLMGDIYLDIEKYDKGISVFQEILKEDPEYFAAYSGIWAARLERVDSSEEEKAAVEEDIRLFLEEHKDNAKALYYAHNGFRYLKKHDDAYKLIMEIFGMEVDAQIVHSLSSYYFNKDIMEMKDLQEREARLLKYIDMFPLTRDRLYIYNTLMHIYRNKPDDSGIKDMIKIANRWLRENPNNRRANYVIANHYIKAGIRLHEAEGFLKRALRLIEHPDPFDKPRYQPYKDWYKNLEKSKARYLYLLGNIYFRWDNFKKADYYYDRALEADDTGAMLFEHIGRLREVEGDERAAYEAYLRACRLGSHDEEIQESLERLTVSLFGDMNGLSVNEFHAEKEGVVYFNDITESAGLSDIIGARVAWGDYNNDGFEDILVDGRILLENDKGKRFVDVSEKVGLSGYRRTTGGIWADFDNDSYLDFYMMGNQENGHLFMRNIDGVRFEDVTPPGSGDIYFNEGAAWGDFDNDGLLDLYVANYEKDSLKSIDLGICQPDFLWRNTGAGFVDISEQAGIRTPIKMCGRGVSPADYNNDGKLDIFVSNYRLDPNFLWINNGDGFVNSAEVTGVEGNMVVGAYGHTIGTVWGDVDNDGDLDMFSANLAHPEYIGFSDKSMLLINTDGAFVDMTEESGIDFNETDSDPSFIDFDNDGDLDLFITSIYKGSKSRMFRNDGDGKFTDVSWLSGLRLDNGWGGAFADFDNDGDQDLVVGSSDGLMLYENMGNENHWIAVGLKNMKGSGIGARVELRAGDMRQIREVEGGKGTASQNSLQVEFGLGDYAGEVEISVRLPSGETRVLKNIRPDQKIELAPF